MFLPKEKVKVPRSLRSARLSVVKNKISTPVIQTTTSAPKKVIKALYDYQAQSPNELSFNRGDFFLVTGATGAPIDNNFYEAFNPISNSRGIVPVPYFQVLEKHERAMVDSVQKREDHIDTQTQPKPQPLYGIVLYDFQAERSDELDAKAGEPIIIIAQSNAEWFVAKPIGRLGGPGLIPVSFVDIRDASTGRTVKNDLMHSPSSSLSNGVFPNVEDWKKQTQGYEASSISLGKIEYQMQHVSIHDEHDNDPVDDYYDMKDNPHPDTMLNNYGMTHLVNTSSSSLLESPVPTSTLSTPRRQTDAGSIVVSAYIDSHILEGDQYWFIVFATLANDKHRVLYRLYDDFYDFQMNFLQEFPTEAGKRDRERILPYMPGPLDTVNDEITAGRARDLSRYCDDLLKLPRYLSESAWVQDQLFGIHEGDIETDIDPSSGRPISNIYSNVATPITPITPTTPTTNTKTSVKVKIVYKDEIFAIKVPANITLNLLESKILDRLGFDAQLKFKDGTELNSLSTEAFESAIHLGKLTVVAS